jgi:hypothetical protein
MAALVDSRPFGVGAGADYRIAEHHRRALHPGAVLAELGHVAGEVRGAGLHHLDAVSGDLALVRHEVGVGLRAHAHLGPMLGVHAALQVAGEAGLHRRHVDHHVGIKVIARENGAIIPAVGLEGVLDPLGRGARHAGHVVGLDEALGAQGVGVTHQQLHGLLHGGALFAAQHRLFQGRQGHHQRSASMRSMI